MVRFRLGRFAWELYYTQTRAMLPRAEVRRRVALIAGHLGYITGGMEYVMTDMLWLRSFALSGCVLIVGYQCAQPRIQMLSAGWNSLYAVVNSYHIFLLLRGLPSISEEETALLELLGENMSAKDFHLLLGAGTWRSFSAGATLPPEEEGSEMLCLVASGSCDVFQAGFPVAVLHAGSVLGAGSLLSTNPDSGTTAIAREDLRCLCLPLGKLRKDRQLQDALQEVLAASLCRRLAALPPHWKEQRYAGLSQLLATLGPEEEEARAEIAKAIEGEQRLAAGPVVE